MKEDVSDVSVDEKNNKDDNILSDHDINMVFGWAVYKVKKKYMKASKTSKEFRIDEAYVEVLEDFVVTEKDIIKDSTYITKYYPIDLALRNKGYLTLISPHYVKYFSDLLKLLSSKAKYHSEDGNKPLPDKKMILEISQKDDVYKCCKLDYVSVYLESEVYNCKKKTNYINCLGTNR